MRKSIFYIVGLAALASCTDDVDVTSPYLNGMEKTPIAVSLRIDEGKNVTRANTRATNGSFEDGDQLLAYIKHVKEVTPVTYVDVYDADINDVEGIKPRLVGFKVTPKADYEAEADNFTNHATSSALTTTDANGIAAGLYWDDFSVGAKGDPNDLRTDGHALQVYYGYCFNGGNVEDFVENVGILFWTVSADQKTTNMKNSDLLWAKKQDPVSYDHGSNNTITGRDRVLSIPYTHAMSKVTIEVVCTDGFKSGNDKNFNNAIVKLTSANTKATLSAPDARITPSTVATDKKEVTLEKVEVAGNKLSCTFSAVIVPSLIKADAETPFAVLSGIDGNDYNLFLTDAIIDAKTNDETNTDAWSQKLAAAGNSYLDPSTTKGYVASAGGLTMPGVNYYIKVTLKKQEIESRATIQDWETVSAIAEGEIILEDKDEVLVIEEENGTPTNVDIKLFDKNKYIDGSSFSLYNLKDADGETVTSVADRTNNAYSFATVCTFVDVAGDVYDYWKKEPELYWPNKTDKYYFRALASYQEEDTKYKISSVGTYATDKGVRVSQGTIEAGKDIIWGTTPEHYVKHANSTSDLGTYHKYNQSEAIEPRNGDVPLQFEHIMSKVTFNLLDENRNATVPDWTEEEYYTLYEHPLNPRLNLHNAKIQISNLYTTGTITIESGEITPGSKESKVFVNNTDETGFLPAKRNGDDTPLTECVEDDEHNPVNLLKDYVMVPQTINNDALITITLNNGATYKAQLNQTKDSNGDFVSKWERGKHYEYTITLSKEAVTFRVKIKDWVEPVQGSGNATLIW